MQKRNEQRIGDQQLNVNLTIFNGDQFYRLTK